MVNLQLSVPNFQELTKQIACEDTNRRCRMMEITPRHVANIIKRWEERTGKESVCIR